MRPIDEKIISMKLNNSDFVSKAAQTTGIIGALTKTLNTIPGVNLGKTSKEIGDIRDQANNTNLNKLLDSIEGISSRFSTLGIIGITALQNITNRAVDAGIALAKSLTFDQVSSGFEEYELKIGSIKTILANTEWEGTSLENVKDALEELNEYADLTIYNFAQMTSNIGRFTAAGVKLDDSVAAIKGLSNLAATSGSEAHQLNTAMYQMSQAMASGRMNLMDWNSLVNAGMGGKITQDALLETAKSMGVVVDMTKSFRDSISDGWLTAEIFLETLKKFGEDESMIENATKIRTFSQMIDTLKEGIGSGWAETWELIFGDFEEATLLWSSLSKVISKPFEVMTQSRNDFLRAIIAGNGLAYVFEGIVNVTKPFAQILGAIRNGFVQVFPPAQVSVIVKLLESFRNLTSGMVLSEKTISNLTTISAGFFSIFSAIWEITKGLTNALFGLLPSFKSIGSGVLSILASFAQLVKSFSDSIKSGTILANILIVLSAVSRLVGVGLDYIGKSLEWFGNKLRPVGTGIDGTNKKLISMGEILTPIGNFFKSFFRSIGDGFNWIKNALSAVGKAIKNVFPSGNDLFAGGFIAGVVTVLGIAIKMAYEIRKFLTDFSGGFSGIGEGVTDVLDNVSGTLKSFSMSIKAKALLTIAFAVGVLAISLKLLSTIDSQAVGSSLTGLIGSLAAVVGAMAIMTKYDITGTGVKSALTIVAMGVAVAIMASGLKKLSELDPGELTRGIIGLVAIMGTLAGAFVLISKFGGAKVGASALQMVGISIAILIILQAIEKMAGIDTGVLVKGVSTLGIVLLELGLFLKLAGGSKFGIGATLGILAVGKAISSIVDTISKIAGIDPRNLITGLVVIGLTLAEIALFAKISSKSGLLTAGVGMLFIAGALTALTLPIKILGGMDLKTLVVGLSAMTVALLAIGLASKLMTGTIAAGIGIALMAGALTLLLVPITAFSLFSWEGLLKGMVGLAGTLLIMGGASLLLAPATVPMLLFGAALALLGVGMLGAGAGMALLSTGLIALAAMTSAAIATIVTTLGTLIVGLASLIPLAVDFVAKIISQLIDKVVELTPKVIDAIVIFILKLVDAIVVLIPRFAEAGAILITSILDTIASYLPDYIDAGTNLIVNFIDGIARNVPRIVEAAANLMVTWIDTMAETIAEYGPKLTDAVVKLIGAILLVVVDAGISMADALFGWVPGVKKAAKKVGSAATDMIRESFMGEELGEEAGEGFATGIDEKAGDVSKSAKNLASLARDSIKGLLNIASPSRVMHGLGMNTGQGFADGIEATGKDTSKAAGSIAGVLLNKLGLKVPVTERGKEAGEGFAKGLESTQPKAEKAATKVAKSQLEIFKEGLDERKFYNNLTLEEELKAWEGMQAKYKKGTDERKQIDRELYRLKNALIKEELDNAKKSMDERKYYNKLTLEQELAEWMEIQAKYVEGTEQRKEADREVYRLEKALIKEGFEYSKKWINERKHYNEVSLTFELELWEKVQARYKKGTDERKEADREVYRLKNELNSKLIQLNDDYVSKVGDANAKLLDGELKAREEYERSVKEANDRLIDEERRLTEEYDKAVQDRTKSLVSFIGLFDQVTEKSDVSGLQLMENLRGQVDTFIYWSDNIRELSARGIDEGLLSELRNMGPKAAAEIAALNSLTDDQLKEYADLWGTKNELARKEAVSELEGLKNDTYSKIEELREETAAQLEIYLTEWVDKIRELRSQSEEQLEVLREEWISKLDELSNGTKDKFVELEKDMKEVGADVIRGMMDGLESMSSPLLNQARGIAESVAATIKSALKIQSPSKVTKALGVFTGMGLADGISSQAKNVATRSKELALSAKESLGNFLDGLNDSPEDNELKFKIVVDDSEFDPEKYKSRLMASMPDTSFTRSGASAIRALNRQNGDNTLRDSNREPQVVTKEVKIDQHLNFHSRQMTPSEVARKNLQVSRQLATQWGV